MDIWIGIDNLLEITVLMDKNKYEVKDWLEGTLHFKQ